MLSGKRIILVTSVIIVNLNIVFAAGWKENAKAVDISGGEDHTLVLTRNKWPWACGDIAPICAALRQGGCTINIEQ